MFLRAPISSDASSRTGKACPDNEVGRGKGAAVDRSGRGSFTGRERRLPARLRAHMSCVLGVLGVAARISSSQSQILNHSSAQLRSRRGSDVDPSTEVVSNHSHSLLRSEWRWSKWHVALLRDNGRCSNPSLRRRAGSWPGRTGGPVGKLPGVNGLLLEPLLARGAIARRAGRGARSERASAVSGSRPGSGDGDWRPNESAELFFSFSFQFIFK